MKLAVTIDNDTGRLADGFTEYAMNKREQIQTFPRELDKEKTAEILFFSVHPEPVEGLRKTKNASTGSARTE